MALFKFSKISAKLYNLLYWMSPDHILKLVGQTRETGNGGDGGSGDGGNEGEGGMEKVRD